MRSCCSAHANGTFGRIRSNFCGSPIAIAVVEMDMVQVDSGYVQENRHKPKMYSSLKTAGFGSVAFQQISSKRCYPSECSLDTPCLVQCMHFQLAKYEPTTVACFKNRLKFSRIRNAVLFHLALLVLLYLLSNSLRQIKKSKAILPFRRGRYSFCDCCRQQEELALY